MSCFPMDRYIVQPHFRKFTVVDTFNHNAACFSYGFDDHMVAASVAREMNKAFNQRPVPTNSVGLPFDRWINLLQSPANNEQVVSEMQTASTLMQKLIAVMDGESV